MPQRGSEETQAPVMLRLLTRGATTAYFPQAATIISLTEANDLLESSVASIRRSRAQNGS